MSSSGEVEAPRIDFGVDTMRNHQGPSTATTPKLLDQGARGHKRSYRMNSTSRSRWRKPRLWC